MAGSEYPCGFQATIRIPPSPPETTKKASPAGGFFRCFWTEDGGIRRRSPLRGARLSESPIFRRAAAGRLRRRLRRTIFCRCAAAARAVGARRQPPRGQDRYCSLHPWLLQQGTPAFSSGQSAALRLRTEYGSKETYRSVRIYLPTTRWREVACVGTMTGGTTPRLEQYFAARAIASLYSLMNIAA